MLLLRSTKRAARPARVRGTEGARRRWCGAKAVPNSLGTAEVRYPGAARPASRGAQGALEDEGHAQKTWKKLLVFYIGQ